MGEDFPLDPNQVQPPQEGQPEQPHEGSATHIEVTSHDGDNQLGEVALVGNSEESKTHENEQQADDGPSHLGSVDHSEEGRIQDEDKARDMAEAGDSYRTKAMENRDEKTAWKHEKSFQGRTPEYRAEFYDDQADKAEKTAGEIYDEAQSSDYTNDTDKAKRMIKAERYHNTMNLAAPTGAEEGAKYDFERAEGEVGKPRAEALKDAPDYDMSKIFLRYSHVIAENYRKHGDELTVNLKALETAYNSMRRYGNRIQEYEFGKYVSVEVNSEKAGAIDITTSGRNIGNKTEKWHIPMFDDDPKGHSHTGTYARPRDFAYYEVTETTRDTDEDFDKIQTKKTRALGEKDVANLGKLFGKVADYKAMERANTLYPGDDGYAEELAEINYGRDL
jgi:hypothetical protein